MHIIDQTMRRKFYHYLVFLCTLLFPLLFIACSGQPKLQTLSPNSVILAFGDSLTYGTGATAETSYPATLEKLIGEKIINAGIPGEETAQGIQRITEELETYNPQLVIVCLGGNDMLRKRPLADVKANLKTIIQTIQTHGAQVVLIGVPAPNITLQVPSFYQELGEEFNIPVNKNAIARLMAEPQYKSDSIHFNSQGYQLLAQDIAQFLKQQGAIQTTHTLPQ